jgi:hypothetical protein
MAYSLMQAAEAAGRAKSTILRAIQSGKVSAIRDEITGGWMIDPAELHRVYPVGANTVPVQNATPPVQRSTEVQHRSATASLQARIEAVEARIAEMQEAQRLRDEVIADLRQQRDREGEERRQVQARLDTATAQLGEALQQVRLLTDQRATPPAPARQSWWRWR